MECNRAGKILLHYNDTRVRGKKNNGLHGEKVMALFPKRIAIRKTLERPRI